MKNIAQLFHILILLALVSSSLLVTPYCSAGQQVVPLSPIEYAFPDQSVWTTKINSEGKLDNPLLHVAEVLFSEMKLQWSANPYPAKRLFLRLKNGRTNFSMLVRVPSLTNCCLFSKKPFTSTELRVYRKLDSAPITDKKDLCGKNVILIRGYSYGGISKYLRDQANDVHIYEAARHDHAFDMLEHGRADYLLNYTGPSEECLLARPISGITHDVIAQLDVFLVLSKSYPNAQDIMDKFESIVRSIDITKFGLRRP